MSRGIANLLTESITLSVMKTEFTIQIQHESKAVFWKTAYRQRKEFLEKLFFMRRLHTQKDDFLWKHFNVKSIFHFFFFSNFLWTEQNVNSLLIFYTLSDFDVNRKWSRENKLSFSQCCISIVCINAFIFYWKKYFY